MKFTIDMEAIKNIVKTDQEREIIPDQLRFEAHVAYYKEILSAMGKEGKVDDSKSVEEQAEALRSKILESVSKEAKAYATKGNKSETVNFEDLLTKGSESIVTLMNLYHTNTKGVNQQKIDEQEQVVGLLTQNFIMQSANAEVNNTISDKNNGSNTMLTNSNSAISNSQKVEQYNALIDAFIDSIQPAGFDQEKEGKGVLTEYYKEMLQGLKISGISQKGAINYAQNGLIADFQNRFVKAIGAGNAVNFTKIEQSLSRDENLFSKMYDEYCKTLSGDKKSQLSEDVKSVVNELNTNTKNNVSTDAKEGFQYITQYPNIDPEIMGTSVKDVMANKKYAQQSIIPPVIIASNYKKLDELKQLSADNENAYVEAKKSVAMYKKICQKGGKLTKEQQENLNECNTVIQQYGNAQKQLDFRYQELQTKQHQLIAEKVNKKVNNMPFNSVESLKDINSLLEGIGITGEIVDVANIDDKEVRDNFQKRVNCDVIATFIGQYDWKGHTKQVDDLIKRINHPEKYTHEVENTIEALLAMVDARKTELKGKITTDDQKNKLLAMLDQYAAKMHGGILNGEIDNLPNIVSDENSKTGIDLKQIVVNRAKLRLVQERLIRNELTLTQIAENLDENGQKAFFEKENQMMLDFLNGLAIKYVSPEAASGKEKLTDLEMQVINMMFKKNSEGNFLATRDKTTNALQFSRKALEVLGKNSDILKAFSIAQVEAQLRILQDPTKSKKEREEVKKEMYGHNPEEEKEKDKKQKKVDFKSFWPNKKYKYEYYCALENMLNSYVLSHSTQQYLKQQTEQALKEHQDELAKQAAHENAKDLMFIVMQGAIKEKMQQQGLLNEDGSLTADAETKNKYLVEQYKLITKASGLNKDDCTSDSGIKDDNSKQLTEKGKAKKLIVDATMGIETEMSSDADVAEWIAANELAGLFADSKISTQEYENASLALEENNISITAVDEKNQLHYKSLDEINNDITSLKDKGVDTAQLETLEALRKRLLAMMMKNQTMYTSNNYANSSVITSDVNTNSDLVMGD